MTNFTAYNDNFVHNKSFFEIKSACQTARSVPCSAWIQISVSKTVSVMESILEFSQEQILVLIINMVHVDLSSVPEQTIIVLNNKWIQVYVV